MAELYYMVDRKNCLLCRPPMSVRLLNELFTDHEGMHCFLVSFSVFCGEPFEFMNLWRLNSTREYFGLKKCALPSN